MSVDRTTDLGWSSRLLVVSTISIFGLLLVCVVGGYMLYTQNTSTEETLRVSQTRADAASKAQSAILIMGKAEVQLISTSNPAEQRNTEILMIQASSTLDESIQRLGETLGDNAKVK